jgi:hypothetical protein
MFEDKDELLGFGYDIGKEVAKRLGVEYEAATTDWNGIPKYFLHIKIYAPYSIFQLYLCLQMCYNVCILTVYSVIRGEAHGYRGVQNSFINR